MTKWNVMKCAAAVSAAALLVYGSIWLFKDDTMQTINDAKLAEYSPASILVAEAETAFVTETVMFDTVENADESMTETAIESLVNTPISPDSCEQLKAQATDLRDKYPNAIGWLYVPGTSINYPVMQCGDNAFYLKHAPDGKTLKCGSVFLDYRCENAFRNNYNLLYAHNMKNGTMFADVCKFKNPTFFTAHPQAYLTTPDTVYVVDFFSVAVTDWCDSIYNGFLPLSERVSHIREISRIYEDIEMNENDRLVSLSTCSYEFENARTVLTGRIMEVVK